MLNDRYTPPPPVMQDTMTLCYHCVTALIRVACTMSHIQANWLSKFNTYHCRCLSTRVVDENYYEVRYVQKMQLLISTVITPLRMIYVPTPGPDYTSNCLPLLVYNFTWNDTIPGSCLLYHHRYY